MKAGLALALLLLVSVSFAWQTSCYATRYDILGYTFGVSSQGTALSCTTDLSQMYFKVVSGGASYSENYLNIGAGSQITNIVMPNTTGWIDGVSGAAISIKCLATGGTNTSLAGGETFNITIEDFNTTHKLINLTNDVGVPASGFSEQICPRTSKLEITVGGTYGGTGGGYLLHYWNVTNPTEAETGTVSFPAPRGTYLSINTINNLVVRSDFKTGAKVFTAGNTTTYCKAMLYFNSPTYGNIQLIPSLTYIPSVDAFANFYNYSNNAAYLANNTIQYVYDGTTKTWYIVPPTVCDPTTLTTISTLAYNSTSTTYSGGTVPFDITSISGSCSYESTTRVVSCAGTDTSNTITSLNLTAYAIGNTTAVCNTGSAGASATLTCTLPNVNGTYSAFFYGYDSSGFMHMFTSKECVVGEQPGTIFGREGYLAVLLVVGVLAMIITSSLALSMFLACVGLLLGIFLGFIPGGLNATVGVVLMVVAIALIYRMKI